MSSPTSIVSYSPEETKQILEIYHELSDNHAASTGKDFSALTETVLKGIMSDHLALNIRVKLIEIAGETAFSCFPGKLGNFLDCFLSALGASMRDVIQGDEVSRKNSVLIAEAILRALVCLCHASPSSNQPHMVRELSDVLLQIAHFCHVISTNSARSSANAVDVSRISTAVSKAMQRMPHLNFESVLVKVMHWMNRNGRQEEKNEEIKQSEARFASKELTRIIRDQLLHIRFSKEDSSDEIVRENMRKFFIRSFNAFDYFKSSDTIKFIWKNGLRQTGLFDDERTSKILQDSMKIMIECAQSGSTQERTNDDYFTSNLVIIEIILSECTIAKNIDADTLLSYLQTLLVEAGKVFLTNSNLNIQRDDILRCAKIVSVLLSQSGKYTPTNLEDLFVTHASIFFDPINAYIETMSNAGDQLMDVFYLEGLLGQLFGIIEGCPVILLKIMQIRRSDTVTFTDGHANQSIVGKVVIFLQSLTNIKEHLSSSCMKEAMYAAKRKSLQRQGNASPFSQRFVRACTIVQRIIDGFLVSSSHFPRGIAFSWENGHGKNSVKGKSKKKNASAEDSAKKSKIWIPTGVKESLNRQMLQF